MDKITVKDVVGALEEKYPLYYAEDFDNTGLLTGSLNDPVQGILVTLDSTEEVVEEAARRGCNLIVSFHPIVFKGLRSLSTDSYVTRAVVSAIRHGISIYALHTAMDNDFEGVNAAICERIGLSDRQILIPKPSSMGLVTTYVPQKQADRVREALFEAGGGKIGRYDGCSYNLSGEGTFRPLEGASPFVGEVGRVHRENEIRISMVFPFHLKRQIVGALRRSHPYEEPALEILLLDNPHPQVGMGMVGVLDEEMDEMSFLEMLKERLRSGCVRYSDLLGRKIKKVAVLGGAGAFAISKAISFGADAFVSADFKYHDFFSANGRILLADIGHYESEQFTKNILLDYLKEKFTNFAVCISDEKTNPINYL